MAVTPYYKFEQLKQPDGTLIVDANNAPVMGWTSPVGLPTPSEVRNRWCYGLPLTNEHGDAMTDEDLLEFLEGAVAQMERELGIFLKPTIISCNGASRGLTEGVDFDKEEPPYDYDAKAWVNYGFLQLRERPVISVQEFKLVLPNYQVIMDFMARPEWIKYNLNGGQLRIVPYAGDPSLFNMAGGTLSGYPFIAGAIQGQIPQMMYVSYTAGYAIGKLPKDVRNIVAKIAAVDTLGIAGESLLAGVANMSTSIDGLSESFGTTASAENTTYGAHVYQYQKEIDNFFKNGAARSSERGITMIGM